MKHIRPLDEKIAVMGSRDFDALNDAQKLALLIAKGVAQYHQHMNVQFERDGEQMTIFIGRNNHDTDGSDPYVVQFVSTLQDLYALVPALSGSSFNGNEITIMK